MVHAFDKSRRWFALPAGRRAKLATIAVWLVALAIAVPTALNIGSVQSDEVTDRLPADADSTQVAEIQEQVPGDREDQVMIVYHRSGGLTDDDRAAAEEAATQLGKEFGDELELVPSPDGTTLMAPLSQPNPEQDEAVSSAFVDDVREIVGDSQGDLDVFVTGPAAIGADVDAVFEGIDTTLMLVSAGVVAALLILTYRSPFLWLLPLISVGAAAVLTVAAVYTLADLADLTVSTQSFSITIVLVFGAGTDYALLVVARYREELAAHGGDEHAAMRKALRGAGPAVLASASTVALGLLCMLTAVMNDIASLGLIGSVGIICSLVTMLTLFPALLVTVGRRGFWPRIPTARPYAQDGRRWVGVAERLLARPRRTAAVTALVLGVLALGVFNLNGHLGESDQFTNTPDSVTGYEVLSAAEPEQTGRPMTVAARTDEAEQVSETAAAAPEITQVEQDRSGGGWTLLRVTPTAAPDSAAESEAVRDLRNELDDAGHDDALVGGTAAQTADIESATSRDLRVVLPLVIGVVLLILMALLRAVVASLVVVGSVLLCFAGALGIGALVFDHVLGFAGNEPALPVLAFVFGVALGVDYSIFLVARVRDGLDHHGTEDAIRLALRSTGPVIVSAGIVLAATFAVLMVLPFVPMVEVGFVVSVGVLLQALLVQPLLLAPTLVALRRSAWWPGGTDGSGRDERTSRATATMGA